MLGAFMLDGALPGVRWINIWWMHVKWILVMWIHVMQIHVRWIHVRGFVSRNTWVNFRFMLGGSMFGRSM
jgi:hypothetical protein